MSSCSCIYQPGCWGSIACISTSQQPGPPLIHTVPVSQMLMIMSPHHHHPPASPASLMQNPPQHLHHRSFEMFPQQTIKTEIINDLLGERWRDPSKWNRPSCDSPSLPPLRSPPPPPPLHFVSAGLKPEAAQDDYETFSERISRKSQTYELDNFSEKVTFD